MPDLSARPCCAAPSVVRSWCWCLAWLHSCRGVELPGARSPPVFKVSWLGVTTPCRIQPQHNTAKRLLAPLLAACPALLHCTPPAALLPGPGSWLLLSCTCRCPLAPCMLTPDSIDRGRVHPPQTGRARRPTWRAAAGLAPPSVVSPQLPRAHVCPSPPCSVRCDT